MEVCIQQIKGSQKGEARVLYHIKKCQWNIQEKVYVSKEEGSSEVDG